MQQLLAAYLLARKLELLMLFFFRLSAAVHQKVLQYPVKWDSKGRINAHWKMKTFPSKSTPFFGISDIWYTSLNPLKDDECLVP